MSYPTKHPHNDLSHDVDRLSRIVKATKELNSTLDLSELARIILRIVRDEVGIERGTVFVMSPNRLGLASLAAQEIDTEIRVQLGSGIAGTVAKNGEVIDIPDAYADDRFDQSFDARLGFRTNDIYCMPARNGKGSIVGVLQLLNRSRALTRNDEEFLADISIHIGLAVENAAKHVRMLEESRIEKQLELAREIMLIKSVRTTRLLLGALRLRCPLCLGGRCFKGLFGTRQSCEDCGYFFLRQNSFLLGSPFFAWFASLAVAILTLAALDYLVDPTTNSATLGVLLTAAILPLVFFRFWRMLWIALDLHARPPAETDFIRKNRPASETQATSAEAAHVDRHPPENLVT